MAYNVEKLLMDAATLVSRLKEHDGTASILIAQTQTLHKRIDAMKEYQDDITQLNEIAKHRPRSNLVIGIAQENRQIRELQQENRELHVALDEHQSALELIMKKYREQINTLIQTNSMEKAISGTKDSSMDVEKLINKICEMASVMQKSVNVDEDAISQDRQRLTQLEVENKGLRELLEICSTAKYHIMNNIETDDKCTQVEAVDVDSSVAPSVVKPRQQGAITEEENIDEKQETEGDEKHGEKTPVNQDTDSVSQS